MLHSFSYYIKVPALVCLRVHRIQEEWLPKIPGLKRKRSVNQTWYRWGITSCTGLFERNASLSNFPPCALDLLLKMGWFYNNKTFQCVRRFFWTAQYKEWPQFFKAQTNGPAGVEAPCSNDLAMTVGISSLSTAAGILAFVAFVSCLRKRKRSMRRPSLSKRGESIMMYDTSIPGIER